MSVVCLSCRLSLMIFENSVEKSDINNGSFFHQLSYLLFTVGRGG